MEESNKIKLTGKWWSTSTAKPKAAITSHGCISLNKKKFIFNLKFTIATSTDIFQLITLYFKQWLTK